MGLKICQKHGVSKCRECRRAWSRSWRANNADKARASVKWATIKAKYGLSREQYEETVSKQNGLCAICSEKPTKALRVVHDHTSGQTRALLCDLCNKGLGMFRERSDFLTSALEYLERYESSV